jgi:beta-galactosidase/beta-glucuronidase
MAPFYEIGPSGRPQLLEGQRITSPLMKILYSSVPMFVTSAGVGILALLGGTHHEQDVYAPMLEEDDSGTGSAPAVYGTWDYHRHGGEPNTHTGDTSSHYGPTFGSSHGMTSASRSVDAKMPRNMYLLRDYTPY